jgi:Spy/CpxP family protein refolding chaperone
MRKALMTMMAVFLIAAFASQSLAWWWPSERSDREKLTGRITKKLELNDEQKEKFKAHRERMKETMAADRKKLEELAKDLKKDLAKDDPDEALARRLTKQIGEKRTEMELKRLDSLFELRKGLTPEQRKKFKGMLNPRGTRSFGRQHKRR